MRRVWPGRRADCRERAAVFQSIFLCANVPCSLCEERWSRAAPPAGEGGDGSMASLHRTFSAAPVPAVCLRICVNDARGLCAVLASVSSPRRTCDEAATRRFTWLQIVICMAANRVRASAASEKGTRGLECFEHVWFCVPSAPNLLCMCPRELLCANTSLAETPRERRILWRTTAPDISAHARPPLQVTDEELDAILGHLDSKDGAITIAEVRQAFFNLDLPASYADRSQVSARVPCLSIRPPVF